MTFYRFARAVVCSVFKVLFGVRVTGYENVPEPRRLHRRALAPLHPRHPVRRVRHEAPHPLHGQARAVLVEVRRAAVPALRRDPGRPGQHGPRRAPAFQEALREGEPLGIFPEGTRYTGRVLGELFDGAAYLALKLGVPIIPVGIGGSEEILADGQGGPAPAQGRGSSSGSHSSRRRWTAGSPGRRSRRSPRSCASACRPASTRPGAAPASDARPASTRGPGEPGPAGQSASARAPLTRRRRGRR